MDITCQNCKRKWHLEESHVIRREKGSFKCRCGRELHSWSGSTDYEPIQMFDYPAVLKSSLMTQEKLELPAGAQIEVTRSRTVSGGLRNPESYRIVRYCNKTFRTNEGDLLRALGDPFDPVA